MVLKMKIQTRKTIDTLIGVVGIGLMAFGLYEVFTPDDKGMNLVQKFGATLGTPEVAQYAKSALIAKMEYLTGALGTIYALRRKGM